MEYPIPLISEIDPTTVEDDNYYILYPTEAHKASGSQWCFTGRDLKVVLEDSVKMVNAMMWGTNPRGIDLSEFPLWKQLKKE